MGIPEAGARLNPSVRHCPALLIGAPASGQGKTTVTAALARYHVARGRRVRVFKTGPDFIDPMILEVASGHPVYQLDLWMVGEAECRRLLGPAVQEADLILIEGVMGLFDGRPSSADLAAALGIPVLAVIDAAAMAETFGALAHGLATYRAGLPFAGVLANRVASTAHLGMLQSSVPSGVPFLGALYRHSEFGLPERHLGLIQAQEITDLEQRLDALAQAIGETELAALPGRVAFGQSSIPDPPRLLQGVRIGVARDLAFSFVYPANLDLLRAMGAELVFFSPLCDPVLPSVDSVYLPGGYPELHIETLASNERMKQELCQHVAADKPVLAECGGMLYLLDELCDSEGYTGRMCGILPGRARMQRRLMGLGLQSARFESGEVRGHTFHHSQLESSMPPSTKAARQNGTDGEAIYRRGRVTASYLHWYLPSAPAVAAEMLHP
ncbi:MAG: cobyrinate a,c-diamide synthase [Gammaproteobacteria bacterium]